MGKSNYSKTTPMTAVEKRLRDAEAARKKSWGCFRKRSHKSWPEKQVVRDSELASFF